MIRMPRNPTDVCVWMKSDGTFLVRLVDDNWHFVLHNVLCYYSRWDEVRTNNLEPVFRIPVVGLARRDGANCVRVIRETLGVISPPRGSVGFVWVSPDGSEVRRSGTVVGLGLDESHARKMLSFGIGSVRIGYASYCDDSPDHFG